MDASRRRNVSDRAERADAHFGLGRTVVPPEAAKEILKNFRRKISVPLAEGTYMNDRFQRLTMWVVEDDQSREGDGEPFGPGAVRGMSLSGFRRKLREFRTPFVAVRGVQVSIFESTPDNE